jgi:hypothetical protein
MTTTTRKASKSVKTRKAATTKVENSEQMRTWAHRYVLSACTLSVALNAYSGWEGAVGVQAFIAIIVNGCIPALALMLGKCAGYAQLTQRTRLAQIGAIVATVLLFLSIAHCSHALSVLTGSNLIQCTALAIVIDFGMLYTEYLTIAK